MTRPGCTARPFTVAVTAADACSEPHLLRMLRPIVRYSRHGVLVATASYLGDRFWSAHGGSRGAALILQPCTVDRAPIGDAVAVGPIDTEIDAAIACSWVSAGVWDRDALPVRMRLVANPLSVNGLN